MSKSFRKYRFVRKAARTQWYIGPWLYASFFLSVPALVFLMGVQHSTVAWLACAVLLAVICWRWWQQRVYEAAFWEQKRKLAVWFEEGRLHASSDGMELPQSESLDDIAAVDALVERGMVVRLLVDKVDGSRTIYAGFDDMEAFAAEFRRAAPRAKFRRVKLGFPMKLKEI